MRACCKATAKPNVPMLHTCDNFILQQIIPSLIAKIHNNRQKKVLGQDSFHPTFRLVWTCLGETCGASGRSEYNRTPQQTPAIGVCVESRVGFTNNRVWPHPRMTRHCLMT